MFVFVTIAPSVGAIYYVVTFTPFPIADKVSSVAAILKIKSSKNWFYFFKSISKKCIM